MYQQALLFQNILTALVGFALYAGGGGVAISGYSHVDPDKPSNSSLLCNKLPSLPFCIDGDPCDIFPSLPLCDIEGNPWNLLVDVAQLKTNGLVVGALMLINGLLVLAIGFGTAGFIKAGMGRKRSERNGHAVSK